MIKIKNHATHPLALAILLATTSLAPAEDWPRWGGQDPGRNMYSPEKHLPAQIQSRQSQTQLRGDRPFHDAKRQVGRQARLADSYGNPVVANGKVLVGTNNASPRDPRFTDDRSILLCLDEYTGNFMWQLVVPKLASGKVNDWEFLGILASPDVVGDKVYVVTSRCEVLCLDLNGQSNGNQGPFMDEGKYMAGPGKPPVEVTSHDADILWRYDMMDELGVFPHNATNCSVITLGDTLFTCTSNGQDWTHVNIPSPQSPSFIALNRNTGEFLAEDDAAIGPRIKHGEWSSPSIGTINGKPQVYYGGGDGVLYAFAPTPTKEGDSTYLKKIWWFDCVPEEYKHDKAGKLDQVPGSERAERNQRHAGLLQEPCLCGHRPGPGAR